MVECPRFCGSDVLLRIQVQHTILWNNLHFDLAVNDIHELMNIIDSMHFMCTPPKTFASWEMNTVCVWGGGGGGGGGIPRKTAMSFILWVKMAIFGKPL